MDYFKFYYKLITTNNGLDIMETLIYSYVIDRTGLQMRYNPTLPLRITFQEFNDTFRLSKWTIIRILKSLEDKHFIEIKKEKGKPNEFYLVKEKFLELYKDDGGTGKDNRVG